MKPDCKTCSCIECRCMSEANERALELAEREDSEKSDEWVEAAEIH